MSEFGDSSSGYLASASNDHELPFDADDVEAYGSNGEECSHNSFGNNNNHEKNNGHVNLYLAELKKERECTDPCNKTVITLLNKEIERVSQDVSDNCHSGSSASKPMLDICSTKPIKLVEKIRIPASDYPKVNFMGRLLGPQGRTLKAIQNQFGCRMAILGKGSIRDKIKEQELIDSGDQKYAHLNDEMHISVSILAPTIEAYNRLCRVMEAIAPFLRPEFDETTSNGEYPLSAPAPFQYSSYGGYSSLVPVAPANPQVLPASYQTPRGTANGYAASSATRGRLATRGRGMPTGFNSRGRSGSSRGSSYSAGSTRFRPY